MSYVLLFTIFEFMISAILFYKVGYHLLEDVITNMLSEKRETIIIKKRLQIKNVKLKQLEIIKKFDILKIKIKKKKKKINLNPITLPKR